MQKTGWHSEINAMAAGIRRRVLALALERNGCYLSQALSSAECVAMLYGRVLRLGPSEAPAMPIRFPGTPGAKVARGIGANYNGPRGPGYDRLLISPAHYAVVIYAALVEAGRLDQAGLQEFNTDGSTVEMIGGEHSPGFELTTGSFGQALSQAGGIAMARRLHGEDGRVVVFLSDGELQEGQTWEALQCLAFHRLGNVTVLCDVNGQQVDGATDEVMKIEPIADRLRAFGADPVKVDGHDLDQLDEALRQDPAAEAPRVVLAYTDTARGLPTLDARKPKLHFVRFKDEQERELYRRQLAEWEAGRHQGQP